MSLIARAAAIDFGIQAVAFIAAAALQTEKFYDFTGSCTFLILAWFSQSAAGAPASPRLAVNAALVGLWALRLGVFLTYRVIKRGGDSRFDKVGPALGPGVRGH
jgi:steroid 5-alpha reductase family enzyme